MRIVQFLIGTAIAAVLVSSPSQAQSGYANTGYGGDTLRCESKDGRTQRCDTRGAYAELVRQLSSTPCTRDRTWGSDSYGVWVSGGCRAEFRVDSSNGYGNSGYGNDYGNNSGNGYTNSYGNDYGNDYSSNGVIRCESRDGRTQRCDTGGGDAQLIRRLSSSPCDRGRNWGTDSRGVWVSGGCRAEFRIDRYNSNNGYGGGYGQGNSGIVRCESRDGRSTECAIPNSRRSSVRLIRQMSSQPCVEGDTWGRSSGGVWVTRGCRAEFVSTRGGGNDSWQRPPGDTGSGSNNGSTGSPGGTGNTPGNNGNTAGQQVRCESNDQRTVRCNAAVYRRVELVRQLSSAACTEGGTWGWDREGVWVSRGCRGEFQVW